MPIFEPELENLLEFFENEIRRFVFLGAFYEAELARTSARMVAMNRAEEAAGGLLKEKSVALRHERLEEQAARLLEVFSRIRQWQKHHN